MSKKFYTADFHLGMRQILEYENRPFQTIEQMNYKLISTCCEQSKMDDVIIHVGDLATWKYDRGEFGLNVRPEEIVKQIPATFINIRGNHDPSNKITSIAKSLRTSLGKKYVNVSVSHYPSYDERSENSFIKNDIHLCGHVHRKWKHCLDTTNHVLNINVGVDVWNYKIVSEEELINYIDYIIKLPKEQINRVAIDQFGKVYNV